MICSLLFIHIPISDVFVESVLPLLHGTWRQRKIKLSNAPWQTIWFSLPFLTKPISNNLWFVIIKINSLIWKQTYKYGHEHAAMVMVFVCWWWWWWWWRWHTTCICIWYDFTVPTKSSIECMPIIYHYH